MIYIYFKNHAEKEAGKLVTDLFLIFKKAWIEVEASGLQQVSIYFDIPQRNIQ